MKIVPDEARMYHKTSSWHWLTSHKLLGSMHLYVIIVHFLKLMREVLKHVPSERYIQLMIGGFKTVNLAWINKFAMIGYTWLFVYESAHRYQGRTNAAPGPQLTF